MKSLIIKIRKEEVEANKREKERIRYIVQREECEREKSIKSKVKKKFIMKLYFRFYNVGSCITPV